MDKRILELRQQIDMLDEEIILLLKKRMGISKEVGKLKEKLEIPVEDKNRDTRNASSVANRQGLKLPQIGNDKSPDPHNVVAFKKVSYNFERLFT